MIQPNHVCLKIKPHFSVVAHGPNTVELRSGVWNPISHTLSDDENKNYLLKLVTAMDGTSSVGEISDKLNISIAEIESLVDHLQQIGAIQNSPSTAIDSYLEQVMPVLSVSNVTSEVITPRRPILLMGCNDLIDSTLPLLQKTLGHEFIKVLNHDDSRIKFLKEENNDYLHNGLDLEKILPFFEEWKEYFIVFLQKNIDPPLCIKLNRILYSLKTPWIHAAIDGPFLFVGPTFSHSIACYECFETRISMNVKDNGCYQKYKNALINHQVHNHSELPITPILVNLLASHVAMEITNFSISSTSFTQGKVLSIYLPTMEINFNEFLRFPNCKTCGSHNLRNGKTLYFDINQLLGE